MLATQIKEARAKLGLSQSQAAKAWGVNVATLRAWERGRNEPRGLALTKLREILATVGVASTSSDTSASRPKTKRP